MDILRGLIASGIVKFAIPIAISAVLQQLLNASDIIIVGQFAGTEALAAVGANTFVITLMVNLFMGLSIGANVVIARMIGAGDDSGASRAAHSTVALALLCGLLLAGVGVTAAESILRMLQTPVDILADAALYFRIIFLSMPFQLLYNFSAAILRSRGDTKRPLYVLAGCSVLNVLLNLLLTAWLGWGVRGVAIATAISITVGSFIMLRLLMRETGVLRIDLRRIRVHLPSAGMIARIGIPAGLQGVVFSFSNVILQGAINTIGTDAVASAAAALNFENLCYFVVVAFGQAGTSFLSQNYGAQQWERCRSVVKHTILLGAGAEILVTLICIVWRHPLSSWFVDSPAVAELIALRMLIVLPLAFVNGIDDIISNMMRAIGHPLLPSLISVTGICGVRLLWIFLAFPLVHDYGFLLYCYPLSWSATALVMMPTFAVIARRKLRRPAA